MVHEPPEPSWQTARRALPHPKLVIACAGCKEEITVDLLQLEKQDVLECHNCRASTDLETDQRKRAIQDLGSAVRRFVDVLWT